MHFLSQMVEPLRETFKITVHLNHTCVETNAKPAISSFLSCNKIFIILKNKVVFYLDDISIKGQLLLLVWFLLNRSVEEENEPCNCPSIK